MEMCELDKVDGLKAQKSKTTGLFHAIKCHESDDCVSQDDAISANVSSESLG